MKKLISAILALLMMIACTGSLAERDIAEGELVTLAELKNTAPASVLFTIDGATYDAPVVLPEGAALPTIICKRAAYNAILLDAE